jgi:hypothetical protein
MQEIKSGSDWPRVMVRAWGDEPVALYLYRIENTRCYVGSENCTRPIGLPNDQVFHFDVDRFSTLRAAFKRGDARKLRRSWADIPVEDFACNRYQDMLALKHDQEHFADTERVTSGNAQ